jgi:hypothetical protein
MKNHILLLSAVTVSLFLCAACDGVRTSDYPDNSVNTTRRVDDIKQNARDQKDAVEVEAGELSNKLDFDERQIREKHKADRQALVNASDKEATTRDAKMRAFEIQAKHDKDVIDAEGADKLKTSPSENAAQITAEMTSRKAEVDNKLTADLAPFVSETERGKADLVQRGIEIDLAESKKISVLEQERSKTRNATREKMLKIDRWTNDELAKVSKDSDSASK